MIKIFIDTNIFINIWCKEVDNKTGKELWRGSLEVLELVEENKIVGVTGLTNLMEICHLFQIRNLNFDEALNDLENLGLDIFIPDTLTMINAFKIQKTYKIDPYDSIVLASAIESNCDYIITRDKTFIKKGKELIDLLTPEEFLNKLKLSL